MDRIENVASNNSTLPRKRLYRVTIGGHIESSTDSPLITHGPHRKWRGQQLFYCCVYSLSWERLYRAVASYWK
jgi:hypothetical protein